MSFLRLRFEGAAALPPEIAFLAGAGIDPRLLARAAELAARAGTDAATALLNAGLMAEEAYYRALAKALGAPFLDGPIPFGAGLRYPDSLGAGLAPLALGACAPCVLAPRGAAIAELLDGHSRAGLPAITTPTRLREAVFAACPDAVAAHAAEGLRQATPERAVAPEPVARWLLFLGLLATAAACAFAALPPPLALALALAGQVLFLAMTTFRIAALFIAAPVKAEPALPLTDAALPVYTVLVALHREAAVVPRLVSALARLDYPAAKLDIKFLIEWDDPETAGALAAVPFPARFEVVVVPPGLPRTKPRALNAALPLARGSLLVVYDAEDVPDAGQLRAAAARFAAEPGTACLQGRLVIDNPADGWLARQFALEYAGLFDVVNPALCALDLPVPLGGTSMHLRTRVLRELNGWDAWNVTEDADLGMRLALAGHRVGDLPSATLEEAPAGFRPWLAQRTRWMKGFLQTSLVHGRRPLANLRRLGPLEALCAVAMVPGTVASAMAYPVCLALAAWTFLVRGVEAAPSLLVNLNAGLALTLFAAGLAALVLPAALGCRRRGWRDLWSSLPGLPVYFCLVSLAAWLALVELIRAPARWNKTEHGLARHSRSGLLRPRGNGRAARIVVPG